MDKPNFVYVIYIASTPEKVFAAIQDPEMTKVYWGRHRNASDWKPGSRWEHQDYADASTVDIAGEVVESVPPHRLAITWADPREDGVPGKSSRVSFDIEMVGENVRLTVTHDELEADSGMLRGISAGWPAVLSSLKTLLETGRGLPGTDRRWGH